LTRCDWTDGCCTILRECWQDVIGPMADEKA